MFIIGSDDINKINIFLEIPFGTIPKENVDYYNGHNWKGNRVMLVSCIIPTYRQMKYLFTTVESVLNQNYENIELIVTDDASDDFEENGIIQFIESHRNENLKQFRVLHHKSNLGTVKNINSAIKICEGEIIIPLASDDAFYDNSVIDRIVNRFLNGKIDVLVCSRMKCSEDLTSEIRLMPHTKYYKYIETHMNETEKQYKHMALGDTMEFASGAAMYYKADFIKKFGGYDERYILWEDGPFIARTTRAGTKIHMAYDIIAIKYRDGGISTKKSESIQKNKIFEDYYNIIQYEYLDHSERFSMIEKKIISERLGFQKAGNRVTIKNMLKYPLACMNIVNIKRKKAMLRLK